MFASLQLHKHVDTNFRQPENFLLIKPAYFSVFYSLLELKYDTIADFSYTK
ncbi:MAG: hypothetical protein IJ881_05380 [Neisseriaceae bacterium]|nr:hypothetical protein [Neisseriaceae bacterium]MBR3425937.1 hypothetical protein [Neisseriaceae bacterium]